MKNLNFYLSVFVLAFFALMTGCSNDTGNGVTTDPLKLTVTESGTSTYKPGTDVVYSFNAVSSEKMSNLVVTPSKGAPETIPLGNDKGSKSGTYTYKIAATEVVGTDITIKFVATDAVTSFTETKTFKVVGNAVPLAVSNTGYVYHILGAKQGAWDLVANAGVSEGSTATRYVGTNKDMINVENTAVGAFEKKFVAGNTTRFVKATGFDYTNATLEAAKAAYTAGTALGEAGGTTLATLKSPVTCALGEIYVAKLRGADNYAVIKIEEILDDGATSNNDYIKFSYKKATTAKRGGKTIMEYF
jgi:hypothetical protein